MATMGSSALAFAPETTLEDPLAHLPRSTVVEYKRKRIIYSEERPSTGICLIISGRVKVCRSGYDGQEAVVDIYRADDLFGESALIGAPYNTERATALEDTKLMTWSAAEIEDIITRRPKLAVALLQILAQRMVEFGQRIQSFSLDDGAHRLARSLIRLSERLGTPTEDGSIQMAALTHELLSQYVGTSREIITHHMNHFRRQGYLRYSRKGIALYRDAFREWLRKDVSFVKA
jgi:CRP/FNR family cyclic AMP-dependent transcriptional regulator